MMKQNTTGDLPTNIPLTMSSLEIAGLCGKSHGHVLRDAYKMLNELGADQSKFGSVYLDAKGEERRCLNLPKRETLILVSGYSTELRARIIDRWQELEAAVAAPTAAFELTGEVRKVIGGIVKAIVHSEITTAIKEVLPEAIRAELGARNFCIREGKTAGQILRDLGYPRIKGLAVWFANKLVKAGCQLPGNARGSVGLTRARQFDPDRVSEYMSVGGKLLLEHKIAERRGQGVLRLVSKQVQP